MSEADAAAQKRVKLRYAGTCRLCGTSLLAGADAIYERMTKSVRCVECEVATSVEWEEPVESGEAGASARREFERRKTKREERIRTAHPKLGGLILALSGDPQSTMAWATGAAGEARLGKRLDDLASESIRVLHDRRIPGSRANIDHIAVAPSGVYVIDAKKYKGRPHLKVEGGLLRPRVEKLMVGSRDCTKLVDGVLKQVDVVRDAGAAEVPIHGILCFVEADWPLIGGAFTTHGVEALWQKRLASKLSADGPLDTATIAALHKRLATTLTTA